MFVELRYLILLVVNQLFEAAIFNYKKNQKATGKNDILGGMRPIGSEVIIDENRNVVLNLFTRFIPAIIVSFIRQSMLAQLF